MYSYIHKGKINVSAQENGFKVFSRWYKTNLRLHKISPTIPPNYWRCSDKDGSLLHIWWLCPLIQNFQKEIHRLIPDRIFPSSITPSPHLHPRKRLPPLPICTPLECRKNVYPSPLEITQSPYHCGVDQTCKQSSGKGGSGTPSQRYIHQIPKNMGLLTSLLNDCRILPTIVLVLSEDR